MAEEHRRLLREINERLAALTGVDYAPPKEEPAEADIRVGFASDYLRAMWSLMDQLKEEGASILAEGQAMICEALGLPAGSSLDAGPDDAFVKATERISDPLSENKARLFAKQRDYTIVNHMFWAELRREFPALADKNHIHVHPDWSVGWVEEPVAAVGQMLMGGIVLEFAQRDNGLGAQLGRLFRRTFGRR